MALENIANIARRIVPMRAKRIGRKRPTLAAQPIPSDPLRIFWGAVPLVAATACSNRVKAGGRKSWALTGAALRYLIVLCAYTQKESRRCFTDQGKLAAILGIARREAARYERILANKGIITVTDKPRRDGQFQVRVVEVRLNAPLQAPEIAPLVREDFEAAMTPTDENSRVSGPLKAFGTK